ncbi:MAG: ABC transporter permease [Candidatus Sericytochromatia bacterium]
MSLLLQIFSLGFVLQALRISLPYILAASGGLLSERSGVTALALEGMMLNGAFAATLATHQSGSAWVGVLAGVLAGGLTAALYALVVLRFRANQIISGVAINLLAAGLTRFLLRAFFDSSSNSARIDGLPVLTLGPPEQSWGAVLNQTLGHPLLWITLLMVPLLGFVLAKTPWGLHVSAAGEHPHAAQTLGIRVLRLRLICVLLSGLLAGLAGVWLALDQHQFTQGMTGGRGYIAIAAMIFGRWQPLPVMGACFLFGGAEALQYALQSAGTPIPNQLIQMIPYLMTLLALTGLMGQAQAPAALGEPLHDESR